EKLFLTKFLIIFQILVVKNTNSYLTGQNLQGSLPPELIRLPYIQQINFSLNFLSGKIPKEWGSLKLVNMYVFSLIFPFPTIIFSSLITLFGNRLSGPIPVELANITTLRCLILESNNFSGNLPPQLGYLPNIEIFRLGDNQFSGTIPSFIKNWTSLQILDIQGSGLGGPFPTGFSFPQSLTILEVSDLNGPDSTFPLVNIIGLRRLILRSCNINDTIPYYIGNLTNLKVFLLLLPYKLWWRQDNHWKYDI
ncbi:putative LRR receptor-like serine/threonine-protein kinase, partial [Mucuna pruriens]